MLGFVNSHLGLLNSCSTNRRKPGSRQFILIIAFIACCVDGIVWIKLFGVTPSGLGIPTFKMFLNVYLSTDELLLHEYKAKPHLYSLSYARFPYDERN